MKKILALLLVSLFLFSMVGCSIDLSEKFAEISDNILSQAVGLAGGLLKEDTSVDTSNFDSELIKDTSSTPSGGEEPEPPIVEDPPPNLVPYDRPQLPLSRYIGFNVNSKNYRERNFYGYGRFTRTTEDYISNTDGYSFLAVLGLEASVHLSFDLSLVGDSQEDAYTTVQLAEMVTSFAKKYCDPYDGIYKIRRFELGANPDKTISAEEYASLLNLCYDANLGAEKSLNYGVAGVNPAVKIIAGQMSTVDVDYVKSLMTALSSLRNDGFSPIGGWSFSYMKSEAPEAYLTDTALNELIAYRNENYSNLEIIIGEFGWDSKNTESPYYVAPTEKYTSEELQCAYIVRSYLIFDKMGIDKCSLVAFDDTETDGFGVYKLVDEGGTMKLREKVSYYGVQALFSVSDGMYFKEAVVNGENGVYVYTYENENGDVLYAMWSTEEGQSYAIGDCGDSYDVISYDKTTGKFVKESNLTSYDEQPLGEMPIFVVANNIEGDNNGNY